LAEDRLRGHVVGDLRWQITTGEMVRMEKILQDHFEREQQSANGRSLKIALMARPARAAGG